jgi:hypothetical protein
MQTSSRAAKYARKIGRSEVKICPEPRDPESLYGARDGCSARPYFPQCTEVLAADYTENVKYLRLDLSSQTHRPAQRPPN